MKFTFTMPTRLFFEENGVLNHAEEFAKLGKKAMIITGKHSAKASGALLDVETTLSKSGVEYRIFDRVENNPTMTTARIAADKTATFGADFVIGIGGGSPIDAAKAVAVLVANPSMEVSELFKSKYEKALPIVAIPTTAGTGTEATQYSVLANEELQTKLGFGNYHTFPALSFLDARYTASLSLDVTINTAIDAFSHSLEGYLANRSNIITDCLALDAITMFGSAIDSLTAGKLDFSTREKLLYVSMLGGVVIAQASVTLQHGMGYCFTYFHDIPHGKANGLLMREYLKFVYPEVKDKVDTAMSRMGFSSIDAFAGKLEQLIGKAPLLSAKEVEQYTKLSLLQKGSIANTPRTVTETEICSIWQKFAK
ncbi:MAG: iron-containing alcohol dehydrogenase family protein [Christensenellales bacterium]|jgi:alcohol dehydrogenase class IV